jgi:hypothetical protein
MKNWKYNGSVHLLFTGLEKGYDSFITEVPDNISTEFRITKTPVKLVEMCMHKVFKKSSYRFI